MPLFETEGSDALRLVVAESVSGIKNPFFDNANKVLCERNRIMDVISTDELDKSNELRLNI